MSQLKAIKIERFRGIREGSIQGLTDVNVLIGRNNSGKTTVTEAISFGLVYLADGSGRDAIGRPPLSVWEGVRPGKFPEPEVWYRQDKAKPIILTTLTGDTTRQTEHVCTMHQDGSATGRRAEPPDREFGRGLSILRPPDGLDPQIENSLWPQILGNRRDKYLTRSMNEIFQTQAEGFQLLPDRRLMVLYPEHSLPFDLQGDGTRTAMRFLMVLASLQETLLIFEEPECYQHPGSLQRLARAFCKQAREHSVQLVISTHSAECVQAFLDAAREASSRSAVFHLSLDDGHLETRRLEPETVSQLTETGLDVRFLDLYA